MLADLLMPALREDSFGEGQKSGALAVSRCLEYNPHVGRAGILPGPQIKLSRVINLKIHSVL